MDVIKRKRGGEWCEFKVYSQEEADEKGIQYTHWRSAEPGTWILTDDGYVAEYLFERRIPKKRRKGETKAWYFSFGMKMQSKTPLLYLPHRFVRDYWHSPPRSWVEREENRTRTKTLVQVFVRQLLNGNVDYAILGRIYRKDQAVPQATVKRLLKQERIQKMVKEELRKEMTEMGLTEKWVLDTIKQATAIAQGKEDAGNMLKAAGMVGDYLEMAKEEQPSYAEFGISGELEESISKARQEVDKITAHHVGVDEVKDAEYEEID